MVVLVKSLFKASIDRIKTNIDHYVPFLAEHKQSALQQLDQYFCSREYSLPSNILDAFMNALASEASCNIKVYYLTDNGNLQHHVIKPFENVDLGNVSRDSPCKSNQERYVKAEVQVKKELFATAAIDDTFTDSRYSHSVSSDASHLSHQPQQPIECITLGDSPCNDSEEDEVAAASTKFCDKRKYIHSEAFKGVKIISLMSVPHDIDGLCVFQVPIPQESTLKPFKGAQPWGRAQSSKISTFDKGPRLLFNCRGSFVCPNLKCSNLAEFGVNRSGFVCKDSVEVCKPAILMKAMKENSQATRETMIQQAVQSILEQGTYEEALQTAKLHTDTTYADKAKKKLKMENRPEGSQSFSAVKLLQDTYMTEDPFLVYDFSDGYDESVPFVIKSSKLKVKIMRMLDKDGLHPLSDGTVHLDVLRSWSKGWKTYTLSYYDKFFCELVQLAVMETKSEDWKGCEVFFKVINRMIKDHVVNDGKDASNFSFNLYHLKDAEHGGNKIGMARVFGESFVKERTSSCLYHLDLSIRNHRKLVSKETQVEYQILWGELKDAVKKQAYNLAYRGLAKLYETQVESSKKPLFAALKFCHECRFRWATAWRSSLQGIPLSSLAEPAQASMNAGSQINVSLVDGIFADIVDSARLEDKWENRKSGEPSQGSGPSALELLQRDKRRQLKRSAHFINEAVQVDFTCISQLEEDHLDVSKILDPSRSHRPDKRATSVKRLSSWPYKASSSPESSSNPLPAATKARPRSIECASFQKLLRKSLGESGNMKILSFQKSANNVAISLQHSKTKCNLQFGQKFSCNCVCQQRARKTSCVHIAWCLLKVFQLEQNDRLLAQLLIGNEILDYLLERVNDAVENSLFTFTKTKERVYHQKLKDHPKFNEEQVWYLSRKARRKCCPCAGCLEPGKICMGDLHLYVNGLLYLEKEDIVKIVKQMRFCINRKCVINIQSIFNNIHPLENTTVRKDPLVGRLTNEEKANIQVEGFTVQGIPPIDLQ
eukprot:gene13304-14677_t